MIAYFRRMIRLYRRHEIARLMRVRNRARTMN